MRTVLLGLLVLALYSACGQNYDTIYIDPGHTGPESGTIAQPFNSWSNVGFQDNKVYLQKRGTVAEGGLSIIGKTHLKISAYGNGERPVITGIWGIPANIIGISRSHHCVIENLVLEGHYPEAPTAGVQISGHWSTGISSNITIQNCEIKHCYNGVRILPGVTYVETVTIKDCEIHHIEEDGIFGMDVSNFSCINTHIYKVNLDWHYDCHDPSCSSGDGIHLSGDCDNFLIDNCIIDRRYTGLKFCFIHNSDDGGYGNSGIIRDCIFYPPKDTVGAMPAGGAIFLFDGDSILIERTKIIGGDRIYSNDAGTGGQLSFDYIFMDYVLADSVHNLVVSMRNEECYINNSVFTSNADGYTILDVGGGEAYVKNTVIAAGPNTTPYYDIDHADSCRIYVGPSDNWAAEFGWVDWGSGNYHLTPNSPLIDQGIFTGIETDLDHNPVPQGAATDIGVYEYQSGSSSQIPVPEFDASEIVITAMEEISFYDQSINTPTTWFWVFEGGTPSYSILQNPTIVFADEGTYNVSLSISNAFGGGQITKEDFITVESAGSSFILKAIFEGPFSSPAMTTQLNELGLIPLSHPYNADPWNYGGTESVEAIPNSQVVDWVLVELRRSTGGPQHASSDSTLWKKAGFILSDGMIVNIDGTSHLLVDTEPQPNTYVMIRHRNHIDIISANPVPYIGDKYYYNFSFSPNSSLGQVVKEIVPGKWCIKAGDGNNNNHIDNQDKNEILFNNFGEHGYLQGDYNLDGWVDENDIIDVWRLNVGNGITLP